MAKVPLIRGILRDPQVLAYLSAHVSKAKLHRELPAMVQAARRDFQKACPQPGLELGYINLK